MATYYVRTDGNDGNTGLGSGTGQAWATIGKALGATGITGGDTLYIAAGTYREVVTIGGTYSSATYIYGDPTSSLFSGVTAGEVRITPSGSDNAVSTSYALTATSKNNLNFKDLIIGGMNATTCTNLTIEKCLCFSTSATTSAFVFSGTTNSNFNTVIKQSVFTGTVNGIQYNYRNFGSAQNVGFALSDCVLTGENAILLTDQGTGYGPFLLSGVNIYNCVLMGSTPFRTVQTHTSATGGPNIYNSLIYSTGTYAFSSNPSLGVTENYNRVYGVNTRLGVSQGANTTVASWSGLEFGQSLLQGYGPLQIFGNTFNSPNATAGTASGAPVVDMYGQSWNVTPDIGVAIYRNIGGVGPYLPSERNASTITIAPGSTSQSIELYLGATGLAFNTSGLKAYFVRNRSAPVEITLVAATTSTWVSGGFAEISAEFTPGIYRLDVPNAAFEAGSSDVTIVVRGASGTNGAVLTVTLSSGGLTAAQTGAAVWGTSIAGYGDAGYENFGGVTMVSNGLLIGLDSQVIQLPTQIWDEPLSSHTTAGTTGQRLNANVLADELLGREIGSGSGAGAINERTVRSALRGLRNKTTVINNEMTVYKEDDASTAWSATVSSSDSSKTITGVDPS